MVFIDASVKINDTYYREVLLTQKLLPVMREICGEFFIFQPVFALLRIEDLPIQHAQLIFQQGNVPVHRARANALTIFCSRQVHEKKHYKSHREVIFSLFAGNFPLNQKMAYE